MQFEILVEDLGRGMEIIRRLVEGVSEDEGHKRPDPQSWSVLEVVCHLYDEEREDFQQRIELTLHHPQEAWSPSDPQGWVSSRQYNQRNLADMLEKLAEERSRSLAWLRELQAPDWEAQHQAPFGSIRAGDLLAAWVQHDSLHIRQLVELRYARIVRKVQPYSVQYAGEW